MTRQKLDEMLVAYNQSNDRYGNSRSLQKMKATQSFTDGPLKTKKVGNMQIRNQRHRQTTHNSQIKLDQDFELNPN